MKKISNAILSMIFIAILLLVPLSGVMIEDREFSENENRYLNQKPNLDFKDILSGKYMKDVEGYVNDQFVMRDQLIGIKTDVQMWMGYKDINGVYLADDGYLIEKWIDQDFDIEQLNQNIDSINKFASLNKDKNISVMVVPTAGLILQSKLPDSAPMFDQNYAIDIIKNKLEGSKFIDVRSTLLSHNNDYIFYKTDHHWTTLGAYYSYEEWRKQNVLTECNLSDYEIETVSNSFKGSLFSKVLNKNSAQDSISLFNKVDGQPYKVYYNFEKSCTESVYDYDKLNEKDKYQVFFGGNHPEITIKTSNNNGKHLLVIKDSFANSFVPFLINDYETISIIDLRYFNQDLNDYMNNSLISDVLILYNVKNFSSDKTISKISE